MSVWTIMLIVIISAGAVAFHEEYLRGRPDPPATIFACVALCIAVWWLA
jgi:hypothetical protein